MLSLAVRREVVDDDGLPIHIAEVAQSLKERLKSGRRNRTRVERKKTKAGSSLAAVHGPQTEPRLPRRLEA